MSQTCSLCGKGRLVGCNVSHAHNRTKKVSLPNLQRVKTVHKGSVRTLRVCTRCLRSGLVLKPAVARESSRP